MLEGILGQMASEMQSLQAFDLLTVGMLAALEGILSVDNSLVLAILVRRLPKDQQRKALTYGIAGAFLFRIIALLFAAYLMRLMVFKLIGGAYLVYIAMKHMFFFFREDAHRAGGNAGGNFWKTVAVVELTDIAFSIDSITTAVAMSDKLIIVWLGGILGIVFLRFTAGFLVRLLEKLPKLEDLAYQLIFFIGIKLLLEAFHVEIGHGAFWLMMGVIIILGASLVFRDYHQRTTMAKAHDTLLDDLDRGRTGVEDLFGMDCIPGKVILHLREKNILSVRESDGEDNQKSSRAAV